MILILSIIFSLKRFANGQPRTIIIIISGRRILIGIEQNFRTKTVYESSSSKQQQQ